MPKYNPKDDPQFQKPYVDIEEIREGSVSYRYVHGGFEGTDTRFSFFFPVEKDGYKGRFFHFLAPMQGHEDASIGRTGIEDKIAFAITHGAYFVETNMGVAVVFGALPDPAIVFKASSASAEYSRVVAARLFGEHRPFGYVYGGSGGGFKSTSCFENTDAWDGACPYVIGSPMAIPNMFTVRALTKRVLRHKLPFIADAVDAGGSGDIYAELNDDERAVMEETMKMGFPPKVWQFYKTLDDGALPVLTPAVNMIDPTYYDDFWKLPGYEGSIKTSNAHKDRIQHTATIEEIFLPDEITMHVPFEKEARRLSVPQNKENKIKTGVDESWKRLSSGVIQSGKPAIRLSVLPKGDLYLYGTQVKFTGGEIAGYAVPLEKLDGEWAVLSQGFGLYDLPEKLSKIKVGDTVMLDNCDYIAIQYFHRHQTPDDSYEGFKQFLDSDGKPIYPQRPSLVGPMIAYGGAGSLQSGQFSGKMITVNALMDESALPWQADRYAKQVEKNFGGEHKNHFRIWYIENALHDDSGKAADELRLVRYLGALHQALLDVSAWVEQGIEPPSSSVYEVKDGQIFIPPGAQERKGVQPVPDLKVKGGKKAQAGCGETVELYAEVELPQGTGKLIEARLDIEGDESKAFPIECAFEFLNDEKSKAAIRHSHVFDQAGTYFATLRVKSQREGKNFDIFTHVENLSRVRIVVS